MFHGHVACPDVQDRLLLPHFGEEVSGRPGAPGFHISVATADVFDAILEVLTLPFQVSAQGFV